MFNTIKPLILFPLFFFENSLIYIQKADLQREGDGGGGGERHLPCAVHSWGAETQFLEPSATASQGIHWQVARTRGRARH